MNCKKCGTQIEAGITSCPSCGATVKEPAKLGGTFSIISLVCGILAFLEGGPISPIAAIISGIICLVKDKKNVFAWIGLSLGAYTFLMQLLAYLLLIVFFILYIGVIFFMMFMTMSGMMYM